ncbi:MAG: hypothetical protein ACI9OJ_001233 [Myxococcota bacterium]|jgi:hypothetical protein
MKMLAGGGLGMSMGLPGCRNTTAEEAAGGIPWGTPPESVANLLPQTTPDGVLEVFLMGGLNPWDTFYAVPEHGAPDGDPRYRNTQWHTFQEGENNVASTYRDLCGGTGDLLSPFAPDALGRMVNFGPWLYEFRDRPDILNRTRVFVMQHGFEPHEVASPYALTGHPRGEQRMAATGAHIQRHFSELHGYRPEPYAYTIFSGDSEIEAQFDINSASASGLHPASARPLALRLAEDSERLAQQLRRESMGGYASQSDALINQYLSRYRSQLLVGSSGLHHHASDLDDLVAARRTMADGAAIAHLLPPEILKPQLGSVVCQSQSGLDTTFMGLRLAAHLLTNPTARARYVNYVDSGLINATGAGYDTHDFHVVESSRNLVHLTRNLKFWINDKDENHPQKLDLDRHMVLLTTEFGRTPSPEFGKPKGLDHWPLGYVVVAIGGPITEDHKGVIGSIGPDGIAETGSTPSEMRAATLMAQGIWPFSNQSFAVGDIRNATTEANAASMLMDRFWAPT